jgi:preprotein translocase subunit YajC
MFISPAWADAATAAAPTAGSSPWISILPLLIIFVLFYLLIIRPQSQRIKEHQNVINALKPGDKVVTGGGIYATVIKVIDADVTLEIASGVQVKAQKHTISTLQETKPANDTKKK